MVNLLRPLILKIKELSNRFDTLGSVATENIVPVEKGGIGANNATDARTNLDVYSKNETNWMRKFHVGEDMYTDLMNIDFTNPYSEVNRETYVGTEDASTLINSPILAGSFYAYRQVFCVPLKAGGFEDKYIVTVKLTEHYPVPGRVWTNMFNPVEYRWSGWKSSI